MDDKILKHLEFVQSTINRMSTNSFIIKGWAIALLGIIFGLNNLVGNYLFYSSHYNFPMETVIILLIILLFWFTNAYFLQQERRYIYIYSETIKKFQINNSALILDMNYSNYVNQSNVGKTTKKVWLIVCIVILLLGLMISFFLVHNIFEKIISSVVLCLITTFVLTYLIGSDSLCKFWTCLIVRTVISVYGTLIILVLFINHTMFNNHGKEELEKVKCECVYKINER